MANRAESPNRTWQFSLVQLLAFVFLVACAASIARVFGVASTAPLLGVAGASAAYMWTRCAAQPRVVVPFYGFGVGAITGMFLFDSSYPSYDERFFVGVSLLFIGVLVWIVSACTLTRSRKAG